jgi:YggT family protein
MDILNDLLRTLLGLYQAVLLVRLLMQLTRADFRNPIARAIVQVTDPVILPLRKILPPMGKIDTASVVAIVAVSLVKVSLSFLLLGGGLVPAAFIARGVLVDAARLVLNTYFFSIILNAILSLVAQGTYSPAQSLLGNICEPVLRPVRRLIPSPQGIDLSPLWVSLAIGVLLRVIH